MYNKYELPPELQEEHVDALIIFSKDSEEDQERAERLRDDILELSFDNGNTGKAVFLDDAVPYVTSLIDRLDEAVKFATLIFVIYSNALNDDSVILRSSQAILWHAIEEKTRQRSFIPVIHGEQTSKSLLVRSLQPINTSSTRYKECLKKTIECHLRKRITRTNEQERKQQEFWESSSQSNEISNRTASHPQIEPSVIPVYNGNVNEVSTEDIGANDNAVEGNEESVYGRIGWHNRFASWLDDNLDSVVGVGGIAVFVLLIGLPFRQRLWQLR